jgi:hypothetical protein
MRSPGATPDDSVRLPAYIRRANIGVSNARRHQYAGCHTSLAVSQTSERVTQPRLTSS